MDLTWTEEDWADRPAPTCRSCGSVLAAVEVTAAVEVEFATRVPYRTSALRLLRSALHYCAECTYTAEAVCDALALLGTGKTRTEQESEEA